MTKYNLLPIEDLNNLVRYEPDTGKLFWLPRVANTLPAGSAGFGDDWKANNWNAQHAGREITFRRKDGYIQFQVRRVNIRGHRAAWALFHGEWPQSKIDHINGKTDDNRISNLRLATDTENARNCRLPTNNTSGVSGVCFIPNLQKWGASIGVNGRKVHLGTFRTIDEAIACRAGAAKVAGYSDRHGQSL